MRQRRLFALLTDRFGGLYTKAREALLTLKPGPWALRGAALGAALVGVGRLTLYAATSHSGVGLLAELILGLVLGLLSVALLGALAAGALAALKRVPNMVAGAIVGAALAIHYLPSLLDGLGPWESLHYVLIPIEAALGGSLGAILGGELASAKRQKKLLTVACLLLAVSANAYLAIWLASDGSDEHLLQPEAHDPPGLSPISAPDPSEPGPFAVKSIVYGSGTDSRRPEYGQSADIKTEPVDASRFWPELDGFKRAMRRRYWGFDEKRFPINARVWLPDGEGPFPLVLIVHGNHAMEKPSELGYAYLGELLSSRGFIVASIDQSFLNGSWSGVLQGKEMPARAWMLLEHLRVWRAWSGQEGSPFHRKVDLQNIGLIGHSRGGEAVAVAAAFNELSSYPEDANVKLDYHFSIRSVIAIAPSDEFYRPAGRPAALEDVDYFVIQGGHDGDVSAFMGTRQFKRASFTGEGYHFKCELFIYRANHGQFNTVWGDNDFGSPLGRALSFKALMSGDEQRRAAKVYISAFLEATLRGQREYLPMFRDHRTARSWLPADIYLNRYMDSAFHVVSDYEEDIDPRTTTAPGGALEGEHLKVWREEQPPLRWKGSQNQSNNAVRVGWEKSEEGFCPGEARASYRITLPAGAGQRWALAPGSRLSFALANAGEGSDPPLITVELATDTAKVSLPLSHFAPVHPPLTVRFSKIGWFEERLMKPSEILPHTYELSLGEFMKSSPAFDPAKLRTVTLIFDRAREGAVVLDDIGFSAEGDAPH
jgi:hypothetical protein